MKANQKYVIVRNGKKIVYQIAVVGFRGITTYSLKTGEYKNIDIYRSISEEEYNNIIALASENNYFVYERQTK